MEYGRLSYIVVNLLSPFSSSPCEILHLGETGSLIWNFSDKSMISEESVPLPGATVQAEPRAFPQSRLGRCSQNLLGLWRWLAGIVSWNLS